MGASTYLVIQAVRRRAPRQSVTTDVGTEGDGDLKRGVGVRSAGYDLNDEPMIDDLCLAFCTGKHVEE